MEERHPVIFCLPEAEDSSAAHADSRISDILQGLEPVGILAGGDDGLVVLPYSDRTKRKKKKNVTNISECKIGPTHKTKQNTRVFRERSKERLTHLFGSIEVVVVRS